MTVRTSKSLLDVKSLSQALQAAYGLPPTIDVNLYRISGSDVYQVTDRDRAWFLKVYRSTETDTRRALASVGALDQLSRHGFSAPQPLQTSGGASFVALQAVEGERIAYLYPAIHGREPIETNPNDAYRFGTTAAKMHLLMDTIVLPESLTFIGYDYLFGRYLRGLEQLLPQENRAIQFLRTLARALWDELNQRLPMSSPQFGFCHGDLHTGNAVVTDSGRIFLLDFDACGFGWRAMDIGTYYVTYDWMGLDEESQRKRRQVLSYFLEGYNTIRPITEEEQQSLDLFMAIRHFELLGIGMYRVPFTGSNWVNREQLHAYVEWFREWLRTCEWLTGDLRNP